MLPPLVLRSEEIFLGAKTLKEIFNVFLQFDILFFCFAMAINCWLVAVISIV